MARHTTHYALYAFIFFVFSSLNLQSQSSPKSLKANYSIQKIEQSIPVEEIDVQGLFPGETYLVNIGAEDGKSCPPTASMKIPYTISRETADGYVLQFKATQRSEEIQFKTPCPENAKNNYFTTVQCITCTKTNALPRSADIIRAQSGVDEEVLIRDVFVAGGCYDVDNITYSGADVSKGTFSKGESINVEEGIILSTGNVTDCSGPNSGTSTTTSFSTSKGDTDLNNLLRLIGSTVRTTSDAAVIEFDFTPTADKVSFEYVWASEEYCDFSNSNYNDVFGFFISGPGINGPFTDGAINIAKLPNSNTYVSINSINWQNNKSYYNNNTPGLSALFGGCTFQEVIANAVAKKELEYDGFTDVLTAEVDVIPCETYHIKLAVGDVQDKLYDSAVFLKANSFKLGDPAELTTEIPEATFPDSNLVYESCQESFFVFKRTEDSDRTKAQLVPFTIADESTAEPFSDYSPIQSPITIPIGKDSIKIPVTIYNDGIKEGPETIIFELESACTCEGIFTELVITEPEEPIISFDNLTTCPGGTIEIIPSISGGVGPYSYKWNTTETDPIITAQINEPTTFSVTITDECGAQTNAEVLVAVDEQKAILSGGMVVCNGEPDGQIEVDFTGSAPYSLEYEFNGTTQNITNITTSNYILPVEENGSYEAIGMTSNGCVGVGEGIAEIVNTKVIISHNLSNPKCYDTNNGFIELTLNDDLSNYSYEWSTGGTQEKLENLDEGEYSVNVTNELGCSATETFNLTKPSPINTIIEARGRVNCFTPLGGRIRLTVSGGSPGYVYDWNNGIGNIQNPNGLGGGTYKVEVMDAKGCTATEVVTIQADMEEPMAYVQVDDMLNCLNTEIVLTAEGTSLGDDFSYEWASIDGNISRYETDLRPIVSSGGTYSLKVTDATNGCHKTVDVLVKEDTELPELLLSNAEVLNCKTESQELIGSIVETIEDFSISWESNDGNFLSPTDMLNPEIDAPGTYTMEVTNNKNGCSEEKSIIVSQDIKEPAVNILTPEILTCSRKAVTILSEKEDPTENYDFSWETIDGNFLENRNTENPSVDQPGDYRLRVTDINNFCEIELTTKVLIDTLSPKIEAGQTAVFTCDLQQLNLSGSIEDNRTYDIHWNTTDGGILSGEQTLTPLINESGTYELFVKDEVNGCDNSDIVVITDDLNRPNAFIAEPAPISCKDQSVFLDASQSTQGSNINFRWETFGGDIIDTDNSRAEIGSPGTYLLFVVDENNGCEGKAVTTVELDTISPKVSIIAPEVFSCNSASILLDGTGSDTGPNFTFDWSTIDGTFDSNTDIVSPTITTAGTYEVSILNEENGCSNTSFITITEERPTAINLAVAQPLCFGDRGQANILNVTGGVGPFVYSIDGGDRFNTQPGFTNLRPGVYDLVVKDNNDCLLEESIEIIQPELLTADLGGQIDIDLGDSAILTINTNIPATELAEIIWTPAEGLSCDDCLQPVARPFNTSEFTVEIVDQNGCEATSSLVLLVDQTPNIYIPNIFRPFDSKEGNDRFTIFAKQGTVNQILNLAIFNRWGETVYNRKNFQPNDPSLGWDGFFDRQRMKPAVFIYMVEVEMIDGRKVNMKGDFTLVK